ncbi:hypothetical protein P8452_62646 [Trifolium repens]|nr:hypothetical protein P8452_62646 [Trifolium repens]
MKGIRKQGSINTAEKFKYDTALYDAKMIRILSSVDEIWDSSVIYPFWNPKTGNFENPSEPNVSAETEPVGLTQKTPAKRTASDAQLSSTKSGKHIKNEK